MNAAAGEETFLDALLAALERAQGHNQAVEESPLALLWPDRAGEWEGLIPRLQAARPVLTLGSYRPAERSGPGCWLRYAVECWDEEPLPIIYLPGVSRRDFRALDELPDGLRLLADVALRSCWFCQPGGIDWTVAAFFEHRTYGLNIEVRNDDANRKAMLRALPLLADQPLDELRAHAPWRAIDFDNLAGIAGRRQYQSVTALITQGESARLEFKSTARWDVRQGKFNRAMEEVILKSVAAFLNSNDGGTLLIGVRDDGQIHGLEDDYRTFSQENRQNRDGYENWLLGDLLLRNLGRDLSPFIQVEFERVDAHDVCKLTMAPAPRPVWVSAKGSDDQFYLRAGNASRPLSARDVLEFAGRRWG